jgi:hypothetical protein
VDYQQLWRAGPPDEFGSKVSEQWIADYLSAVNAAPSDILIVDPGNHFNYVFDLAGSLGDSPYAWDPRVVLGVWGGSQPGLAEREDSRRRGHPRPRRHDDDRGHLIAFASGGGYDINLVPMDALLNRGRSEDGIRFRAMERQAAAAPGSLFFIRPLYDDDTDRPSHFEVGVQVGDTLQVESFVNSSTEVATMPLAVLRRSAAFPISAEIVDGCLNSEAPGDALFLRAWRSGIGSLSRSERNAVAGVTGHVAESVAELMLDQLDWRVLWHFIGPGRHGVDLVLLTPDDKLVAVEVKGTLVGGTISRLTRRQLAQMSDAWIDKADNPGMAELGLSSADVYGAVVAVNFRELTWRVALTADFEALHPVEAAEQLAALDWLRGE